MAGIAPGLDGYIASRQLRQNEDAAQMQQAQGLMGILAKVRAEEQEKAIMGVLSSQGTMEQKIGNLSKMGPAGINVADKLMKIGAGQAEAASLASQNEARGQLSRLQTPQGSYNGPVSPNTPTAVSTNDADALRMVQDAEARGQPMGVNVPNPVTLQDLLRRSNPKEYEKAQITAQFRAPQKAPAISRAVVPDENSPTKFSYINLNEPTRMIAPAPAPRANAEKGAASPLGRLHADYIAGRISKEDYDAKKSKDLGTLNLAGGRESTFINRIVLAGNQIAASLKNIAKLPLTASTGFFGGRTQGAGLLDAAKETLTNEATTQEVQTYNVLATGITRSLAAIEAAGLAPAGQLVHQMDAVVFKEGNTNFTKLLKLAETRQITDKGLEVILANPRVPEELKVKVRQIMEEIDAAIPFLPGDMIDLEQQQKTNPNTTLKDIIRLKGESKGIEAQVTASGVPYEPNIYEYRIVGGQVQRKKK